MEAIERVCDPECAPVHKFGPVKIVLIDAPEDELKQKIFGAAAITLAYMFMGAVIMTVLFFSLYWKLSFVNNLHVFLCTVGFQLFIPSGIFMFNNMNGPSVPLKEAEKRYQHWFLQASGGFCGLTGSILVTLIGNTSESKFSLHSFVGFVSCILTILSLSRRILDYFNIEGSLGDILNFIKANHISFGLSGFVTSSICFILGLLKPVFVNWLPMYLWPDVIFILILFCGIYTAIVVYFPFKTLTGFGNKSGQK